jgi:hypothetical protein
LGLGASHHSRAVCQPEEEFGRSKIYHGIKIQIQSINQSISNEIERMGLYKAQEEKASPYDSLGEYEG